MDAELYSQSIEYEQLTQSIYQAILHQEGINNITVEHNTSIKGRSGVEHQIDVFWKFKQAGIEHKVIIECKNYATALTLEKVRNFFAVSHDIGNTTALMVTKTGYQSGATDFANYYGIGLKLLRKPTNDDWKGRVKDIHLRITAKTVASSPSKPLTVTLFFRPKDQAQEARLNDLQNNNRLNITAGPDLVFLDSNRITASEEMRWFLPKELKVLDKEDGGPYTQNIKLEGKYILMNEGEPDEELIEVIGIKASYYVESVREEIISHGELLVENILKDFNSGEIEYVKNKPVT
jgi:hypothetical protein